MKNEVKTNKLTVKDKQNLNLTKNVIANKKTTLKDTKEVKETTKETKPVQHNDKEVNNDVKPVKEDKKDIKLNGRTSCKNQMHILEENFDGTLDSIIIPTTNGKITGYSIVIAIIFAINKDKIELILQMKEQYPDLFQRQLQYLSKKQLDFVKKVIG